VKVMTAPVAHEYSAAVLSEPNRGRAQTTDETRLRQAMRAYLRLVWRVLRRSGLEERDADEAAQDVFFILARRLSDVPTQSEKAFLVGTAIRVAADKRRACRANREVAIEGDLSSAATDVDELVALRRSRALLDEALGSLSDEQRAVFVLVEMDQLKSAEVGEALGIPLGTVASRLKTARQSFDAAIRRIHLREKARMP
jgi:RNA polymerase sigma-70 factor, ECF subfamily